MLSVQKTETNGTSMRFLKKQAAKFAADAPQDRAYDLLRAAISGGYKLPAEGRTSFLRWVDFWGSCVRCSINIPARQPHIGYPACRHPGSVLE